MGKIILPLAWAITLALLVQLSSAAYADGFMPIPPAPALGVPMGCTQVLVCDNANDSSTCHYVLVCK